MSAEIHTLLERLKNLRIAVIGDLMLDHYIAGATERTSPEAPVPVVLIDREEYLAGGAANVARNVAAAGARPFCVGAVGDDEDGQRVKSILADAAINIEGVTIAPHYSTTKKTRIVSQGQQIVRLDHELPKAALAPAAALLARRATAAIAQADAVVLSDYNKGVLSDAVLEQVFATCRAKNIPVVVDPKGRDYSKYRGATAITPNAREARETTGLDTDDEIGLTSAIQKLREITGCRQIVITRGAQGLTLLDEADHIHNIPTAAREVFDVTGAGDTFVAWFTLALAAGYSSEAAARLANTAAGIVVGKAGPAVVSPLDIKHASASSRLGKKLVEPQELASLATQLRTARKKIVFTNGCFDFLHAGHIAFLQQARELGDVLVLAMNSDDSIRRLKGAPRPMILEKQRAELLASIDAVDYLVVFEADTPHALLEALRPDVLVKGANYTLDEVEGADLVKSWQGDVVCIPILHDIRTSRLIGQN